MSLEVKRPRRVATPVAGGLPLPPAIRTPAPISPPPESGQLPNARATARPHAVRRLWRELRGNETRWLFLLIAIGTALALSDRVNRPVLVWSDAGLAWRDALYLLLPWTGAAAAWTAGRERRHGLEELLATTARAPFRRRLWGWMAVSMLGVSAYALVGCWLVFIAASRSSSSRFALGPIMVGFLAIPASAALGFALGAWQPRRATAFATLIGFSFVQIVLAQSASWAAFFTATPSSARATATGITPDLVAQQCWLLLGLTGLGLALLARVSARGWTIRVVLAASIIVILLATASLAAHRDEIRAATPASQTSVLHQRHAPA